MSTLNCEPILSLLQAFFSMLTITTTQHPVRYNMLDDVKTIVTDLKNT